MLRKFRIFLYCSHYNQRSPSQVGLPSQPNTYNEHPTILHSVCASYAPTVTSLTYVSLVHSLALLSRPRPLLVIARYFIRRESDMS